MSLRHQRFVTAALAGVLCLTASGCNGDDAPGPGGQSQTTTTSTPATPTASSVPTPPTGSATTATSEPSDDPTVAPSTGSTLTIPALTIRAPRGWRARQAVSRAASGAVNFEDLSSVGITSAFGEDPTPPSLDEQAKIALEDRRFDRRRPDTTIDGQPAFRIDGTDAGNYVTEIGLIYGDYYIVVSFEFKPGFKDREQVIASVLASATLA